MSGERQLGVQVCCFRHLLNSTFGTCRTQQPLGQSSPSLKMRFPFLSSCVNIDIFCCTVGLSPRFACISRVHRLYMTCKFTWCVCIAGKIVEKLSWNYSVQHEDKMCPCTYLSACMRGCTYATGDALFVFAGVHACNAARAHACVCMYVGMYVCMYVCICTKMCMHAYWCICSHI